MSSLVIYESGRNAHHGKTHLGGAKVCRCDSILRAKNHRFLTRKNHILPSDYWGSKYLTTASANCDATQ